MRIDEKNQPPSSVGVVIPAHNAEQYIREAVDSVVGQTFTDTVICVVDDGSTDATLSIVREMANHFPQICFIRLETNSGPAAARNAALNKLSQHRYIAFLDADDIWYPTKLEAQLRLIRATGVGLIYTAYDVCQYDSELVSTFSVPESVSYRDLLKTCPIGTSTVLVDRKVVGKLEMPPLKRAQDYAAWLKLVRDNGPALGINHSLAKYRIIPGSVSANKLKKAYYQWIVYRKYAKLGLFEALWYFAHYTINGVRKYR